MGDMAEPEILDYNGNVVKGGEKNLSSTVWYTTALTQQSEQIKSMTQAMLIKPKSVIRK